MGRKSPEVRQDNTVIAEAISDFAKRVRASLPLREREITEQFRDGIIEVSISAITRKRLMEAIPYEF